MKRINIAILCLLCLFIIGGCGSKAPDEYKSNMEQFFTNVANLNEMINAINYEDEGSFNKLLGYLDMMDTTFSQMASLEVPNEFSEVSSLAKSASENMSNAVSSYHLAYEEGYDEDSEQEAVAYYQTANDELKEIIKILRNEQ